jgi:hypothetical protein
MQAQAVRIMTLSFAGVMPLPVAPGNRQTTEPAHGATHPKRVKIE